MLVAWIEQNIACRTHLHSYSAQHEMLCLCRVCLILKLRMVSGKKLAFGAQFTCGQACQKQLVQSKFHASLGRSLLHYEHAIPLRMPCIHEEKASLGEHTLQLQ